MTTFVHSHAHVHCNHLDTQCIKMLFSFLLVYDLCPSCWHSDCHYHIFSWSWKCLSEANWIFPHISINNYYAYNTGFSLPAQTNAVLFYVFFYFCTWVMSRKQIRCSNISICSWYLCHFGFFIGYFDIRVTENIGEERGWYLLIISA